MTTMELVQEMEVMIERLTVKADAKTAATRLLYAAKLLADERELLKALGDKSRTRTLLRMSTRLVIRAGELLGDTSREHQWLLELEAEASALKAEAASVGK